MASHGPKPPGRQAFLPDQRPITPRVRPVASDQIPFRQIFRAVRLKWANALSTRIKWSKRIAWVAFPIIPLSGYLWITNQEEMPISGRRRLNFFADGKLREFFSAHEGNHVLQTRFVHLVLALARTEPGITWPDDHPTSLVAKSVCERLVVSNGGDPAAWHVHIANAPGKPSTNLLPIKG